MIGFYALLCWIIAFILAIFRHWIVINIERINEGKEKQAFLKYFFNDIGDNSIMMIEPIFKKYSNIEQEKLRKKTNRLTFSTYLLVVVAISLYVIKNI